jgi:hypothetical protein
VLGFVVSCASSVSSRCEPEVERERDVSDHWMSLELQSVSVGTSDVYCVILVAVTPPALESAPANRY